MNYKKFLPLIALSLISVAVICTRISGYDDKAEDIFYIFLEGKRITEGINPYERVLEGDMVHNNKYATYFPLTYLNAALIIELGYEDYSEWLRIWTIENVLFVLGIGVLIYLVTYSHLGLVASVLSLSFWLFNAFTLKVMKINHVDFFAIFFLLASLAFIRKRNPLSLILFGISLSIKHIGVFIIPILFICLIKEGKSFKKSFWQLVFYSGIVPFILSIPFLFWNFEGFIKSIWFSITRAPASHFGTQSINDLFEIYGFEGKLILLFLCLLVYLLFKRNQIGLYLSCFLILAIFVAFNSVLFFQYLLWPLAFIPFLLIDRFDNQKVSNLRT